MSKDPTSLTTPTSPRAVIDEFLKKHAVSQHSGRARLVFTLDATASRSDTWDSAATLTASMFAAVGSLLDVQLVYFRGIDECKASRWVPDARLLAGLMSKVRCASGHTQIGRILDHAKKEDAKQKVSALVFVGDFCEEDPDTLCAKARELHFPAFMFQEGDDKHATEVFDNIARLTKGAHCHFDQGSAKQLAELLGAVAAYAAGGAQALKDMSSNAGAVRLLKQLR
jgi:hypothetical protein